jgi:hypothetical protein
MKQTGAETLCGWAETDLGLELAPERAGRLAKSLAPVKEAVAAAASTLPFEAEPSTFLAVAARLKAAP